MTPVVCGACGADFGRMERVGRRDTCSKCGVDLHSCRQCRFYDPRAYNECSEPQAERVLDKIRSNFCDYFTPADSACSPGGARAAGAAATAAPPSAGAGRGTREELDRLFRRR